jgi:hypothetical protein
LPIRINRGLGRGLPLALRRDFSCLLNAAGVSKPVSRWLRWRAAGSSAARFSFGSTSLPSLGSRDWRLRARPTSPAFLLLRRVEVTLSWRLGSLAVRQRLRRKPLLKGFNIVEDDPAELYAWRPDVVAMPVVESPLGAPHSVRQLRLCQITGIWIEIGRADRVDNALFESGRGNPVEKTLFENRVQSKPPQWLAPPGLATRSKDARRPRATEKAIGLFSQEGQTFLA